MQHQNYVQVCILTKEVGFYYITRKFVNYTSIITWRMWN